MSKPEVLERIKNDIANNSVVLFMKGSKDQPMCGFSAQVIQVLKQHNVEFKDIDVLADYDVREGIKEVNSWPTIPQLFVKGKFVGGCDITMELHRSGELKKILADLQ
ncbi:MAG: Grx4 family monothiol glutaredoxin [Proteobacteria bacterium]|nr:Grx4 family monothiol glutaredoxin [Pseudomonadota bacterium]